MLGASGARTPSLRVGFAGSASPRGPAPLAPAGTWRSAAGTDASSHLVRLWLPRRPAADEEATPSASRGSRRRGSERGAGRAAGRSRVRRLAGPKRVVRPAVAGVRDGARGRGGPGQTSPSWGRLLGGQAVRGRAWAQSRRPRRNAGSGGRWAGVPQLHRAHPQGQFCSAKVAAARPLQARGRAGGGELEQAWPPAALRPVREREDLGRCPGFVGDPKASPVHEEPGERVAAAATVATSRRRELRWGVEPWLDSRETVPRGRTFLGLFHKASVTRNQNSGQTIPRGGEEFFSYDFVARKIKLKYEKQCCGTKQKSYHDNVWFTSIRFNTRKSQVIY